RRTEVGSRKTEIRSRKKKKRRCLAMMLDIKISGGSVLDGTGSEAMLTDIGIRGERIVAVGDLSKVDADYEVDASGKVVCPGFIDVHSHSDTYLILEPSAHSKLFQGVTTEVVGNCGASAAPLAGEYRLPSDWLDKEYPGSWSSVAEYRELLEAAKPAPNVFLLIGHNTLHAGIAGYEPRAATESELQKMIYSLEKSLDEGARGLSTGLIYAPGIFAPREEIVALAEVVAKYGGIYTSHMRSESKELLAAIEEALSIGRDAGVRVEISHLKASGKNNWDLLDPALELIRNARQAGQEVAADRYPYTSACTDLDVVFPDWAAEGGREAVLKRLRDRSTVARLREDLLASRSDDAWGSITIGSTSHPDNTRFRGVPLPQVAEALGMDSVDAILYLTESDDLKTGAFFSGMSDDNMLKVLKEPFVMLGSDGSLRAPTGVLSHDYPHPRAYGTFAKFVKMSVNGDTVPLPEAVRKMTSLPAAQFKLADRGILAVGNFADILVFDPQEVRDISSFGDPHKLSEGIDEVIVNGVRTLSYGKLTGQRAGQFLKR
ncbi:MAG: D-aminoacylase, partial [Kiritimatiellae bacterium]|nr:D-aminoacylase [Kiritimatiellia bacterium]